MKAIVKEEEMTLPEVIKEIANPRSHPLIPIVNHDSITYKGPKPKGIKEVHSSYLWEISVLFDDPVDLDLLTEIARKRGYKTKTKHFPQYKYPTNYDQNGNVTNTRTNEAFNRFMVLSKWWQGQRPIAAVWSYEPGVALVRVAFLGSSAFGRRIDKNSVELLEEYRKAKYGL